MGSENMTDAVTVNTQPEASVPASPEEQTPAQGLDTEQQPVTVDVEGGSEQPNKGEMTQAQLRAAWKEEKRKRKEKAENEAKLRKQNEDLAREVKELRQSVNNVIRGERPDPFDFDSSDDFYSALDKWEKTGTTATKSDVEATQEQPGILTDDQEFALHQSETSFSSSVPDYIDAKSRVDEALKQSFGVQDNSVSLQISALAYNYDIDPAKVFYALDKMPNKMQELVQNGSDLRKVAKIMRDLEGRVQLREQKKIDSKPEPTVSGGGSVDAIQARLTKAREDYAASPSLENYNKLQAAKRKTKEQS